MVSTAYEARAIFRKMWYTEARWQELIDEHQKAVKAWKSGKGDKPLIMWDLDKARKLLNRKETKTQDDQNYSETRLNAGPERSFVLIVKAYQEGEDAPTFYYSPHDDVGILGEGEGDDLDGEMPLVPYYHKIIRGRIYGMGIAEQLNGEQNDMDQKKRFKQRISNLLMAPMVKSKGVNPRHIKLEPNHVIPLKEGEGDSNFEFVNICLLYTSPSPRDS